VAPSPPEGYQDGFWQQLQGAIEGPPPTVWQRMWVNLSPAYAWVCVAVFTSLLAYQFLQPQERVRIDAANLRYALRVHPMEGGENRELISNRERLAGISQSISEQWVQGTQEPEQKPDTVELSTELLAQTSYFPSLVSEGDALKTETIRDVYPDVMTVAQLSNPDFIAAREDFSQPLGVVETSSPAEVDWGGNRSLSGFVDMLMNVPLPSFSITEVYDAVKL